jgi:hypothetical protein
MAVKQLSKISDLPEPPDRLVGDQERFDVLTFNSLKAQKKMVNEDLNKTLIPALNEFAVDVNASVDAAALSERNAHDSEEVAKRKAGEASGSAGAAKVSEDNAKVSETNALASKNAAALSAESAESARIAAEAARDEAQDLANVGYASESHAGLAKVDGKTTQADAGGAITVKDVAIEGDLGDLASARGQIGDAKEMPNLDFNTLTTPGNYRITGNPTNGPSLPLNISGASIGSLIVAGTLGQNGRIFQIMISGSTVTWRTVQNSTGTTWSAWQQLLSGNKVGDGIRVTNGIISVPEMQGATVSTAGTSGLVPPAAAGQHESFLTGGGEYKPALTKISDSVSLEDSTTAASATAVKSAYDAANERLPLSGGTLTGALRSKPGNIHVASTPSADEVDDALYLVDANGVVYANLQSTNYANGSMLVGLAVNTSVKGGSGGWQTLKIGADKTGKFISHVPTPDLSDASDNIANTVYVQENLKSYLKLAGGILTGDVTVPSVNGYQVVDHEVNGGWYFFPENFYNSGRKGRFLTKAGLKVQYGGVSGMSDVTQQVTFAEPFSTIPIVITTSESSGIEQITVPLGVTTTGFSLGHMSAGTQTGTVFKHWIAIGR